MKTVATYLDRLFDVHRNARGTPELSYRAALENLLNAVGEELEPEVQATAELADTGAGRPDFGLFETKSGSQRAVVEVKSFDEETPDTADGNQVSRYWRHYGCVLVTNYRDFLLVVRQSNTKAVVESRFRFVDSAEQFWQERPTALAKQHGEALVDFLKGALTRTAPILRPTDLAQDLARHAREAKRRLERHDATALEPLQKAMESALGLHFSGDDGLAFFRSSLVQTLFYGLFSGWMLWRRQGGANGNFNWKDASDYLALPLIGDMYEEIARPKRLADLELREPMEWATNSLKRVVTEEFFRDFDADHAITLFYEPFLQAFDPALRKELGVWYTPPEIVSYMVERVDELLRNELGIEDGLADENVFVLDPAAGTGSFLVEVAKRAHRTLDEQGHGAAAAAKIKKALCTRLFGFEILPAPYVIAHLQLGVLLQSIGARLRADERCEVYLTNALTGWEPPKEPKAALLFPELQREAERASRVKQKQPILVVLGNPPYNRFTNVAEDEEADLIEPYKDGLYEKWKVRKQTIDELYVRFFRLAEKRIAEVDGKGVVCYISNYSWLEGLSHPVMRERLLNNFDKLWIDNCNGDKYKTGKRTPDGRPDESMFTTDDHRVGIQLGTAIATFVKHGTADDSAKKPAKVLYREFWGTGNEKRSALLAALNEPSGSDHAYVQIEPQESMRWVLVPAEAGHADFGSWPTLAELFPIHYSGLNENRLSALISDDPDVLERRMKRYFDPSISDAQVKEECEGLMKPAAGYDPHAVRSALLKAEERFASSNIIPLAYRPFDDVWVYWTSRGKLLNRSRPEFYEQVWEGNRFLSASQTGRKGGFNIPTIVDKMGDLHLQDPWSQFFPLFVRSGESLLGQTVEPNLHRDWLEAACRSYDVAAFESDGHTWTEPAVAVAEQLFYHTLAVLWAPRYRKDHAAALKQNWPRIPIPTEKITLEASASLGRRVADLLLLSQPVTGVTAGKLRPELRDLAVPRKTDGKPIDPSADLRVEAGYGFRGARNAVMCGKGKVTPTPDNSDSVEVFINEKVYWSNVPRAVWTMTIGGYPVVKKWLSYREHEIRGSALTLEEVTCITEVVRRIQAIFLLGPKLDESYAASFESALALPTTSA